MFAAREPSARYGPTLHSNDSSFISGAAAAWGLSGADLTERVGKELKRHWLEAGWTHIADRSGSVRRAMCFASRHYQDVGSIDAQVASVMRAIIPTKPLGFAFYYSVSIERIRERTWAAAGAWESTGYMNIDSHTYEFLRETNSIACSYFVSDAAPIASLSVSATPAAWIVLERYSSTGTDLLPVAERTALAGKAPILSTAADITTFVKPLAYSTGTTGIGFYDQSNRLIITASNLTAGSLTASVTIRGMTNATHTATDLFTAATISMTVTAGIGTLAIPLTRWETRAFSVV